MLCDAGDAASKLKQYKSALGETPGYYLPWPHLFDTVDAHVAQRLKDKQQQWAVGRVVQLYHAIVLTFLLLASGSNAWMLRVRE